MNMPINMAKILELALHDGIDPVSGEQIGPHTGDPEQFADFEQLWDAFTTQLDSIISRSAESIRAHERQWP